MKPSPRPPKCPFMPLGHNLPSRFIDNLCAHTTLLSCWKAAFIAERSYTSIWTLDEGGGSQSTSEFSVIWCCGCLVFGLYQHLLFSIIKYNTCLPILKMKLTLKIETKITSITTWNWGYLASTMSILHTFYTIYFDFFSDEFSRHGEPFG